MDENQLGGGLESLPQGAHRGSQRWRLLGGLCIFQGFIERLTAVVRAFHDAPAVIVAAKCCGGTVAGVAGVHDCADFVEGNPSPGEFYVGNVALLGDASDGNQFAPCGGNAEGFAFRVAGSEQALKGIDARRRESDIPAGRRYGGRTPCNCAGNPAVMLEGTVVGGEIILVGDDARGEVERVYGTKSGGSRDQISREAASEKVARRA